MSLPGDAIWETHLSCHQRFFAEDNEVTQKNGQSSKSRETRCWRRALLPARRFFVQFPRWHLANVLWSVPNFRTISALMWHHTAPPAESSNQRNKQRPSEDTRRENDTDRQTDRQRQRMWRRVEVCCQRRHALRRLVRRYDVMGRTNSDLCNVLVSSVSRSGTNSNDRV